MQHTKLGRAQIVSMIYYYKQKRARITERAHKIVRDWLKEHNKVKPTTEEKRELCQRTGLTRFQIKYLFSYYLDPPGKVTSEKKEFIVNEHKKIFSDSDSSHNSGLTNEILQIWKEHTHLNSAQIRSILSFDKTPPGAITEEKRATLRDWLFAHPHKRLTRQQKKQLRNRLKLAPSQFRYLMTSLLEKNGEMTQEKKDTIESWLKAHNTTRLPKDVRQQFQKTLKLSARQIIGIVFHLNHEAGSLTDQNKKVLTDWLERNDRRPAEKETHQLMQQTGLNRIQVRGFVDRYFNRGKVLTAHKKEQLLELLPKDGILSAAAIQEMQQQTNLTKKQIRTFFQRSTEMRGLLTTQKKDHIQEWMKSKNASTESSTMVISKEIADLARQLRLGESQIRQQIRHWRDTQFTFTKQKRDALREWYGASKGTNNIHPSKGDMEQIAQQVELSYRQVYDFCRRQTARKK